MRPSLALACWVCPRSMALSVSSSCPALDGLTSHLTGADACPVCWDCLGGAAEWSHDARLGAERGPASAGLGQHPLSSLDTNICSTRVSLMDLPAPRSPCQMIPTCSPVSSPRRSLKLDDRTLRVVVRDKTPALMHHLCGAPLSDMHAAPNRALGFVPAQIPGRDLVLRACRLGERHIGGASAPASCAGRAERAVVELQGAPQIRASASWSSAGRAWSGRSMSDTLVEHMFRVKASSTDADRAQHSPGPAQLPVAVVRPTQPPPADIPNRPGPCRCDVRHASAEHLGLTDRATRTRANPTKPTQGSVAFDARLSLTSRAVGLRVPSG